MNSRSALLKKLEKDTKCGKIDWSDDSGAFSSNYFTADYQGLKLETEWPQDGWPTLRIFKEDVFSYDMTGSDLGPLLKAIKGQPHILAMRTRQEYLIGKYQMLRESSDRIRSRAKQLEKEILHILN